MTLAHTLLIAVAGLGAGFVNGVVGTGTLVSFPALLVLNIGAFQANIVNTLALIPGYLGNSIGYRRELSGQGPRIIWFGALTIIGSAGGTWAFLALPGSRFREVVPYLILVAAVLMAVQRRVARMVGTTRLEPVSGRGNLESSQPVSRRRLFNPFLVVAMILCGAYAGYFGAGVSVILLAVLGMFLGEPIQPMNALRSVLTLTGNLLAGVVFMVHTRVDWSVVAVMAPLALVGGWLGSSVARKIPEEPLRWAVVAFATAVGLLLIFT